jgi:PAS domain S-box-containing protein
MRKIPLAFPAFYKQIFETAADALVVTDAAGHIQLANRQASRLFGHDAQALLGMGIEDLIPERFRDNHRRYRNHYGQRPESRPMGMNLALWAQHRDGHEFPVEISLSPFPLDDQTLVCANIRDVSELRRAHELAAHARQAMAIVGFGRMALSGTGIDAIQQEACRLPIQHLEAARSLILRSSEPGRQGFAVVASSGFDPARLDRVVATLGERWPTAETVPLDEAIVVEMPATMPGETPQPDEASRSDGGTAGLMLCAIPGEDGCAGLIGACAAGRRQFTHDDASFLQSLANTLGAALQRERAEARLFRSQRLEALGQLTGGVAHDFNNLLTVVSGNLQMLEERLEDPFSRKLAAAAMRATGRGADLTRKLLAFSRRQTLQPRAIEVPQLLDSLADVLRRTLGAHIDVRTECAADLPQVRADPGMLDTALLNLAVNARDAMPDGGRLTLEAHSATLDAGYAARYSEVSPGDYVEISVSDNGSGMPPEVLARAFEPFFTTKDSGKGSGLGLSLVYGFVKQSGGHIVPYSEVGIGTTVRLYLPVASNGTLPQASHDRTEIRGGSETILVVEDDDAVREVADGFLRRLGYRVLLAADAQQALELLEREPDIALLFTDVVLRGEVDGPRLAREAMRRKPGLKALYTSGYARNALPMQRDLDDNIELLGKPYQIGQLARMLRRAIERKKPAAG